MARRTRTKGRKTKKDQKVVQFKKALKVTAKFKKDLAEETPKVRRLVKKLRGFKDAAKLKKGPRKGMHAFDKIIKCNDCGTEERTTSQELHHSTRCVLHQIQFKRARATARMQKRRARLARKKAA